MIGSVHGTLSTVHYTRYTVHCALYTVNGTLSTAHYTRYTVQCALYTVHCPLRTIHCTLPLHQERGQKCGKPGKARPDRSFQAFCRACHKSVAWKSMVTAAKAGLLRLPCPQKPGFRGYTPLYQDCQETAAWKSTVSAAKPGFLGHKCVAFVVLKVLCLFFPWLSCHGKLGHKTPLLLVTKSKQEMQFILFNTKSTS